jgi:geranylgeranyl diphosphate synthase type II
MDDDALRRGVPANHIVFGEATTMLASTSLAAMAIQAVAGSQRVPSARLVAVINELGKAAQAMAWGQLSDLRNSGGECHRRGEDIVRFIHANKTGSLIAACVVAGAISADGVTDEDVAALREFGAKVGHAYQIVDDVLDVISTTDAMGKVTGKDEAAGKATYPGLMGIARSREVALDMIREGCDVIVGRFGEERSRHLTSIARHIAGMLPPPPPGA